MYQRILVPIDGSSTSDKALHEAIQLARLTGAGLFLLHIIEEDRYVNGFEPPRAYCEDVVPFMHRTAGVLLERGKQQALRHGVQAETIQVMGGRQRICDHVTEQAERLRADLVVVGSHGWRGLGRFLLGSDAEQILRHCQLPVLVVRDAAASARKAAGEPANAATQGRAEPCS